MKEDDKRDPPPSAEDSASGQRRISDRVKRAMAAGLEAASRSKDDLLRAAGTEIGAWLERVDLQSELAKFLSKTVVEVKAEIRFHPREDGTLAAQVSGDVDAKPSDKA